MENDECMSGGHAVTDANDSREHIIPNSIGGRRKTKRFLCETCNHKYGTSWDAELASQLNGLCHFFEVKRERGEPPPESVTTTAGESLRLLPGGSLGLEKPNHKVEPAPGGDRIQIAARNMKEARKMLKGFKRKYPQIDIDATLAQAKPATSYPEGMINIPVQIGGPLAGRAIVKSAAALAHECGISISTCEVAASYLRNTVTEPCFGYFNASDLVLNRPQGVPFHCVAISGSPDTGLLLGYVEFFGFLRIVVLLSELYSGPAQSYAYAIDPRTGYELVLNVRLAFSRKDIADIFNYLCADTSIFEQSASAVIGPAHAARSLRERNRVTREAVEYAFKNCGAKEGDRLSEEHCARIAKLVAERLAPFVANVLRPRPDPRNRLAPSHPSDKN